MGGCDLLGWGAGGGGQGGVLGLESDRRQTQMFTRCGVASQTLKWGQVGKGSPEPIWVLVTEREKVEGGEHRPNHGDNAVTFLSTRKGLHHVSSQDVSL